MTRWTSTLRLQEALTKARVRRHCRCFRHHVGLLILRVLMVKWVSGTHQTLISLHNEVKGQAAVRHQTGACQAASLELTPVYLSVIMRRDLHCGVVLEGTRLVVAEDVGGDAVFCDVPPGKTATLQLPFLRVLLLLHHLEVGGACSEVGDAGQGFEDHVCCLHTHAFTRFVVRNY